MTAAEARWSKIGSAAAQIEEVEEDALDEVTEMAQADETVDAAKQA